jgi:hypothetical protein
VTKGGTDTLLPPDENCATLIEAPNALEVSRAFTRKMNHLLCVVSIQYHQPTIVHGLLMLLATDESYPQVQGHLS